MAQRVGKCTNFSGCKLAYRNEKITVVTKDFRCPECGSPLEPVGPRKTVPYTLYVLLGVAAVLLFAVAAIVLTWPKLHPTIVLATPAPTVVPTVTPTPTPAPTTMPAPNPTATPIDASPTPAGAASTPTPELTATPSVAATPLNFDTSNPEIAAVRREILQRIERAPYPQAQKDRAFQLVQNAHGLGRLFSVSFETSLAKLPPQEVGAAGSKTNEPAIKKVLDDPAVVLVILGFADRQGDDARNQQLSQARAQATLEVLKDRCGVLNVMYPIAMGGTDLFDTKNFAKNRIVEVWAVLP